MEENKTSPSSALIRVSVEADRKLNDALEKVNQGFLGGKVSKTDLASWAIAYAFEELSEGMIEKIRKPFFNELAYLESVVKLSRQGGQVKLTPEQYSKLQDLFGPRADKAKTKPGKAEATPGVDRS